MLPEAIIQALTTIWPSIRTWTLNVEKLN